MDDIKIMAIESSCDETSVAVVKNGREIISNIISSQIDMHKKFGGVVPEVASRMHLEVINNIVREALEEAKLSMDDIDAIAVTKGPVLSEPCLFEYQKQRHYLMLVKSRWLASII